MTVEHARLKMVPKPWGSGDLRPYGDLQAAGELIGEIWFERVNTASAEPTLLLKLLFTTEPLSIQVHPDDKFARSIGLIRGKSEAWYVLSAAPDSKIIFGLKQPISAQGLRASIADGSIADLVSYRGVQSGDVVYVPAGTIHAVGAGLVIAEIQQRVDATFRLFDFGRQRPLDLNHGVAVAMADPIDLRSTPRRLGAERTVLVESLPFVFERVDLPALSRFELEATTETWLFVLNGSAKLNSIPGSIGDAFFLQGDAGLIDVGSSGFSALVAYNGPSALPHLLSRVAVERRH